MLREKGISRKVCAIVCSIVMALSLLGAGITVDTITANADGVVTAKITYTAQFDGAFQDVKLSTPVASDTAERYGYVDAVAPSAGVSMLDVWVQIHKDLYTEFNSTNKDEYFVVVPGTYGPQINRAFKRGDGTTLLSCGYYVNGQTAMGLTDIVNEDSVVDIFLYQDAQYYADCYTRFSDMSLSDGYLSGKLLMDTYDNNYNLNSIPVANAEIGWLDINTLEILPANPFVAVRTGEDGSFSVEMPNTSKKYMLTVYDSDANNKILVRTLYIKDYPTPSVITESKSQEERRTIYSDTGRYLSNNNKSIVYGDQKEGYLIGLGRSGQAVDSGLYSGYYESVRNKIKSDGKFDSVAECAKVVTALNAIGYDPTNIDGVDITRQLNDVDSIEASGNKVYGFAYALIALDTKNYESLVRNQYVNKLLEAQLSNGAWGWNANGADIDTTGMVLAALAPYYNNNSSVNAAVNKALDYLSNVQAPSGAFASGLNENSNSTAMVLLGLSELGIDVDNDVRFIKNGVSVVDALCSFAVEGGGFGWTDNVEVNDYATYQAYYALCSYFRHINGMNRLFDMTPEKNIVAVTTSNKVTSVPKTGDRFLRFL